MSYIFKFQNMSLTTIIIVITVLTSFAAWRDSSLMYKLIHNPYTVERNKEYWRLLTCGFIHADYIHLAFNMYSFYLFGGFIEQYFDYLFGAKANAYFLGLYLVGIVVANIPDFLQKRNFANYNSLGASGGVSAVVFCSIILNPLSKLMIFPIPVPMPAYIFAGLYVAYSVYMNRRQMDNVNHLAHLWGAAWGVLFIVLAEPNALSQFVEQIKMSF